MRETKRHLKKWGMWVFLFIGLLLFWGTTGISHLYGRETGVKFYRNYRPEEYGFEPQNWCILQDRRGIIYVANNGWVLEYDGVSWKRPRMTKQVVRFIAMDASGTIYMGGVNELGLLSPDSQGQLEYISLIEHIDENKGNFGSVWRIHATQEGIFLRTSYYLFRWCPKQKQMVAVMEAKKREEDKFNASFTCGGKYFINQRNVGLMQLQNGSFKIISGGETFAPIATVFMIAPYDNSGRKLLIGTREQGFFIYDGKGVRPFPTEVDNYLKEKKACHGIALSQSPGDIAIATLRGGLAIIDFQGRLKYLFTKDFGLYDNNVKYVFEDSRGNLWAALNKGISKIEYSSPLSIYDDYSDLPGMVLSVTRHRKGLYVGTSDGLFYLGSNDTKFKPVPLISGNCWSLMSTGDSLLAATSTGVYQVKNRGIRKITGTPSYVLLRSRQDPNRLWVGMRNTFCSLYRNPNKGKGHWVEENRYKKVDQQIRTMVEDHAGNLWIGTRVSGVLKVDFASDDTIKDYQITRYDTLHKLPEGEIQVFWAAGHVMFGSRQGLFCFDKEKNIFIPDHTLGKKFSSSLKDVYRVVEDKNKSIWLHVRGRNFQAIPKPGHTYEINRELLARIPIRWQVNAIYPDPYENITWFATHEGLIRCDQGVKKIFGYEYHTIIREVSVNGIPQFYNLYTSSLTSNVEENHKRGVPVFYYKNRNFRFEFAAPFFENEARITYSYMLEGYKNDWLELHKETFKDYTNLDAGVYRFRVKGKNVYGTLGREATFRFKILPPWYRTWWAFLFYVLLFFLTIFLTVRWRSTKLKQEKKRLEQVVKERTKEINQKSHQLEKQTILLKDQAKRLKELDHAKSRFFANISHEFRTPLTLIIGPLDQILSGKIPGTLRNKLNLMHQNSHRLLTLINRLLDLSRIDSGKMKLRAAPQDIIPFLKGILASFEHSTRESKLILEFKSPGESIILYFDVEKLEEVFTNLLSNAVKFTPRGGKITVSIKSIMEKEEDFPMGLLEVSVRDTGVGIPQEQLAHIFDRFFQVESHERKHKGSGIGLALTRELVMLHHGKIDVNSRVGENSGTEFILRFPLGKAHLKPQDIVIPSENGIISHPDKQKERLVTVEDEKKQLKTEFEGEVIIESQWTERDTKTETQEKEQDTMKHTVLVVEDNPEMRQFIRESIGPQYTVVEAEDGDEGIQKARALMPDLIISDIMMPKLDGYELCQTLKTDIKTSHIPIILLTAKASEGSKVQGLEIGADDYIIKPFNMKILVTRIKNLIDLRRQLQEKIQRQMLLQPEEIKVSSIDQRFLKKLQEIIEKYISDEDLNVEGLSEKMDISRVTLNKKIQALTGETATEFIRSYRLKRAMQLLKENFGTVLDVAYEVGFSNPSYFARCFREKFHQLPSVFLK